MNSKVPNSVKIIDRHLSKFVNDDEVTVLHEIESDLIHSDVYIIHSNKSIGRDYVILLSCGMSSLEMNVPVEFDSPKRIEVSLLLPSDWSTEYKHFKDENNYWPIRLIKEISKYPHENNTWLGYGHTFSYEEGQFFSESSLFQGAILLDSVTLPDKFTRIRRFLRKDITVLSVIPLYREEINFKINNGTDALLNLFSDHDLSEMVDVERSKVVG